MRNKNGYRNIVGNIKNIREDSLVLEALKNVSISSYRFMSKVFAWLFLNKQYTFLYLFTKLANVLGIGKY